LAGRVSGSVRMSIFLVLIAWTAHVCPLLFEQGLQNPLSCIYNKSMELGAKKIFQRNLHDLLLAVSILSASLLHQRLLCFGFLRNPIL